MNFAVILTVLLLTSIACAEQPARRPLTAPETTELEQPIALGRRILEAWSHYYEVTYHSRPVPVGVDVITNTPTLELLHAAHALSDSDFALCLRCHATLHPVPVGAAKDAPILTLRTSRGEVVFDISGNITLQPSK